MGEPESRPERSFAGEPSHRRRLKDAESFAPWIKAQTLEDTHLFWMPVDGFPMPHDQRAWLLAFLQRWSQAMQETSGVRDEVFLQYKTVGHELANAFNRYVLQYPPLIGLSRRPGASLPTFPEPEEMKRILGNGEPFDSKNWVADFCHAGCLSCKKPDDLRRRPGG